LAALVLPGHAPGLGFVLVGWAVAAAVLTHRAADRPSRLVRYSSLSLACATLVAIRDVAPLTPVLIGAAFSLASLAVSGGEGWMGATRGLWRAWGLVPRSLGPVLKVGLSDRSSKGEGRLRPLLRGLSLGAVLLMVFGGLFFSADRAFAEIAGRALDFEVDLGLVPLRLMILTLVLMATVALIRSAPGSVLGTPAGGWGRLWTSLGEQAAPRLRLRRPDWLIPIVLLDALFVFFITIQLTILFGGNAHVLATAGLTYAEYAREGFFQLILAAILTLGVVAGVAGLADLSAERDRRAARISLGFLCALNLVILASALQRLALYEEAFGLSRLRLFAAWVTLVIGGTFVAILVAGARGRLAMLPHRLVTFAAIALIGVSLANPDRLVAERNVGWFQRTGTIDLMYLASLGADAAPGVAELPEPARGCVLARIATGGPGEQSLWGWNLGRARAERLLRGPFPSSRTCDAVLWNASGSDY
jgi:hypothetical protein